ncbi:MAG: RDD family protein [Candidatus Eremiobacteraeota bacterium]|nr:RDD family protein [Candidatus Eremiobacteraeota bacterium]
MDSYGFAPPQGSPARYSVRERTITVVTPENIEVTYRVAGLATRFFAWAFDTMLQLIAICLFTYILSMAGIVLLSGFAGETANLIALALITFIVFLITNGYFIYFEVRRNGQTPGKKLLYIRAIKSGGLPVSFQDSLVRNLMRIVDMLPGIYGVGAVSILLSGEGQRLGDLAAGTYVILEEPPVKERPPFKKHEYVPEARSLGEEDLELVRQFMQRSVYMNNKSRILLAERTAAYLAGKLDISIPSNRSSESFLNDIITSATEDPPPEPEKAGFGA